MRYDIVVHRIVKSTKLKNQFIEPHSHRFFHLIYQLSGHSTIQVNSRVFQVEQGSLIICIPGDEHSIFSKDTSSSIDIKFSCSDEFKLKLECLSGMLSPLDHKASNLIRDTFEEAVECKADYEEIINLRIYELMLQLLRNHNSVQSREDRGPVQIENIHDPIIRKTFDYIEMHMDEDIKVRELAEMCGYSENYFRLYFSKMTGLSPNKYIYERKIDRAKELMLFSDLTVTEIAEKLGYHSIHYFSRQFRSITGVSPSTYQHQTRETLNINLVQNENTPSDEYEITLQTVEEPPLKYR